MFQQSRRMQLAVTGTILLCLLVGVYLFAVRRSSKPDPSVEKHSVETSPEDALKYWTKSRMRKAKPAELPHINADEKGKRSQRPTRSSKADKPD